MDPIELDKFRRSVAKAGQFRTDDSDGFPPMTAAEVAAFTLALTRDAGSRASVRRNRIGGDFYVEQSGDCGIVLADHIDDLQRARWLAALIGAELWPEAAARPVPVSESPPGGGADEDF